jgi:hypothetical protein
MSVKAFAIATAALVSTASVASATSYFELPRTQGVTSTVELGLVRAEGQGVVEIYDILDTDFAAPIGVQAVNLGANDDVRINTGAPVRRDVVAVLRVDDEIVATERFRVNR